MKNKFFNFCSCLRHFRNDYNSYESFSNRLNKYFDFGVVSVDKINETITDIENEYGTLDKEMLQASEKLEGYFDTVNGVLVINTDVETLASDLNISVSDAQLMIDATNEIDLNTPQLSRFVGVYINLGPKVRKMMYGSWRICRWICGLVCKQFAAAGPVGAGVAAVITAGAAATAKWAVENGIRRISLGKYIGGWNWNYTINIPREVLEWRGSNGLLLSQCYYHSLF